MDNGSLGEVCRVCANKIKDKNRQRHIFNYMRGKLLQNLKLITGVELLVNESLPNFMCERCNSELDLAVKFRERCIFSQHYLQDMLKKSSNAFPSADNELSEELIDEDQLEYIDQDLKFEDINDCIEESYVCEPEYVVGDVSEEELVDAEDFENPGPVESPKKNKRHFVLFQESRPVKRLRNFFICEECGGYFKNENEYKDHLEGHMDRKESIQFYPCNECSLSFNTKSLLNLHRRNEHNGNRLFKCNTCGETFLEHTAKQRHEIAHVNERPYPCLECDKIFGSVSELRMHSTTHSQRKFRCEPCNRDFTTRYQLDVHSNTNPHKRTVQQMQDEIDMLCGGGDVEDEEQEYEEEEEENGEDDLIEFS
ncbi:zinc finger protein 708 [Drosophila innubila]|uniref:zinc finger protein 708 n=1 Tax=Drosophila innubila TaxID=198719 RepID=UPI00148B938E|nr:zinc finger protein 708 [Drosophila innubila]